jgi:glycosyltransferase involved in cell wall biosynthesis
MEALVVGGSERRFLRLARSLDRQRFQPVICTLRAGGMLEDEVRASGIPIVRCTRHGRFDPSPVPLLAAYLRAERIDIVHSMHQLSNMFAMLAALAAPRVAVVGSMVAELYHISPSGRYRLMADRLLWHRMDVMSANAEVLRAYLARCGFPPERVAVVPNGVEIPPSDSLSASARADARAALGVTLDVPLVGIVGRLESQKDHATFLRAASAVRDRVPDARFVIVGGGSLQPDLINQAAALNLTEVVTFTGELPRAERVLPAFDIFVLCSRFEGMPNALLEAGALGIPLITTPVQGASEIVLDGRTGLLTPVGDATTLAARIGLLMDNPALRARLGQAARAHVAANFSAATMTRGYQAVYERAVGARHSARP